MLYTISKLRKSRIQRFKPCTKWGIYGLRKTTASGLCEIFAQHLGCAKIVRNSHNTRLTFAQPMHGANFPLFLHARTTDFPYIFSLIFSHVNSFCNLIFRRHKALSCNFTIYRGAQRLQKKWDDWGIDPLYINLEIYKALFLSRFPFLFPISIFLVAKQPLRAFPQRMIG